MAKVDIKLGTALVNTFDGSPDKLESFIDAVTLFSDSVHAEFNAATPAQKEAAKLTLARFVKTRVTGIARQAIGELNETEAMLDAIKTRCASKTTSDSILAKLKSVKQSSTTENFCDAVEKLTNDLRSAYITEKIPQDRAEIMATKRGVETLISGIKNSETKLILKAGTFSKFQDAVQKLQENEAGRETQTHVFHVRGNNNYRGRGRYNNNRGNRFRGRNNNNGGRYQNSGQYNNNNYRTGNTWRGGNNYYSNQRNQGPGRQVFYANQNQGNAQVPQQQQIGGLVNQQPIQQQIQPVQLAHIAQQRQ